MVSVVTKMRKLCFCMLFFFFMFCYCGFSKLSSDQTSTMIVLSRFINSSAWNSPGSEPNPCSWKGVLCTQSNNSSVTHLSLSGFDLSNSSFLPFVCKIETLESLDVSSNRLSSIPDGFITDCEKIDGLKLLNFSNNRLASLPRFNGFAGLEILDLSNNMLEGNIGLEFDGLIRLNSLNLSFNRFTGSVPTHLGKMRTLEKLEISSNSLTGTIPKGITDYKNLSLIDLSNNQLSGSIPFSIWNLSKLEIFLLSNNRLSGEIPESISGIKSLERFAANQNNFVGKIPSGITRSLRNLDLSFNKLNGSIPSDFLFQPQLFAVDLSYNLLVGSIPRNISPNLVRLRLGSNKLTGMIPSPTFLTLEKLTYLELENNSLTGVLPAELGSCKSLALLNFAQNEFTGVLPVEFGNLSNIQVMKLQHNKLYGEIPVDITHLSKLSVLNISWNSLSGSIPSSVSNFKMLYNMNLQGNNLRGSIPDSIGDMKSLIELQLGQNQLSGKILKMPSSLQICLNLSHNNFEGPIPNSFSQLSGLEVLDLSNNRFSGEIPAFLTQLGALTQLVLSNNQLFGVIPRFTRHVLLETNGNPGLKSSTVTPNTPKEPSKKRKLVGVAIFVSLAAAAFTVGIVTSIALLVSRCFYKVNNMQLERREEDSPFPQAVQGNLLTANGIHRSNIDFCKAMEAIADPVNVFSKTRFSTYYKAVMPSGTSYFIKKLDLRNKLFQSTSQNKLVEELEVLGKACNSNVMIPLAYVLSANNAFLFYEFSLKGTLFDILHGNSGDFLHWTSRYNIAIGIAQGISFLHGCNSGPILLLDLSSRTIMLKSLNEPQIGDIELFKVIDPSKSTSSLSAVAGSIGYIPPEYAYMMRVTMAGNVYSFGVILLELVTGKPAVSEGLELAKWVSNHSMQEDKWDLIPDSKLSKTSSVSVRSQMAAVLKIALACICASPGARPKMNSVVRMLLNAK